MECDASTSRRFSRLLVLTRCIYFFCLGFGFVMYVRSMHPRVLWRVVDIPARLYLHLEFRVYIYFFFGVWTVTALFFFFPLSKHMVHPGGYPSWGWLIGLSLDRDKVLYKLFYPDQGMTRQGLSLCHFKMSPFIYSVHHTQTEHRLSTIVTFWLIPQIVDSFPSTRATETTRSPRVVFHWCRSEMTHQSG